MLRLCYSTVETRRGRVLVELFANCCFILSHDFSCVLYLSLSGYLLIYYVILVWADLCDL